MELSIPLDSYWQALLLSLLQVFVVVSNIFGEEDRAQYSQAFLFVYDGLREFPFCQRT